MIKNILTDEELVQVTNEHGTFVTKADDFASFIEDWQHKIQKSRETICNSQTGL